MKQFILLLIISLFAGNIKGQSCDFQNYEGPMYFDTYHERYNQEESWAHYNVHDPTVYKDGEYYYMYNTDVGLGYDAGSGALKRRSKNLVDWEFLGRAFDGVPQSARDFFLQHNPNYTDNGIWAPFITKYENEYRLYYSAPGGLDGENLAFIGLATSSSANGPWVDQGKVTTSVPNDTINAIDPTVLIDSAGGKHWMAYGSYQNGIYMVELDPATGKIKTEGDRGHRIAARNGGRHAAIEGPELSYRDGWYYLFVSYDWLEDHYNVRVGRSRNPEGPYYDIQGNNMAAYSDNGPMIQAPYRFNHHEGWQGTAHCAVYEDDGQYYMFNQARPSLSIFNMVLHVRKVFWIDGWPVVSPERYAQVPQCEIPEDSLVGEWEHLLLIYNTSQMHATTDKIELGADGTINSNSNNEWSLEDSLLTLSWNNGEFVDQLIVSRGWDWENRCLTLVYTGMNADGLCMWGKKINQSVVNRYTKLVDGATYTLRNHYSNMYMEVPGDANQNGSSVMQGLKENSEKQLWRLTDAGEGYYKLHSLASDSGLILETSGASNNANIRLWRNYGWERQLFKPVYDNNGYFHILSKISNDESCIDLGGFSIEEGGNMIHWEYLEGLNQLWRLKRIDSIALDTTDRIQIPPGNNTNSLSKSSFVPLEVYPNPSYTGQVILQTQRNAGEQIRNVSVFTSKGSLIKSVKALNNELELDLQAGFYLIQIVTDQKQYLKKLIVY